MMTMMMFSTPKTKINFLKRSFTYSSAMLLLLSNKIINR